MKAWLYSASSNGDLRAAWAIADNDVDTLSGNVEQPENLVEAAAVEALAKPGEPDFPAILTLAARSDAWRAVTSEDWRQGIQVIVVDYQLPGGNCLLTTFTFPYDQQLSAAQVAQLVERVVSGQGGCCI